MESKREKRDPAFIEDCRVGPACETAAPIDLVAASASCDQIKLALRDIKGGGLTRDADPGVWADAKPSDQK